MARTTKLELQQALNAMGVELQALREEVSKLRFDNERLARERDELSTAYDHLKVEHYHAECDLADATFGLLASAPIADHPAHNAAPKAAAPAAPRMTEARARYLAQRAAREAAGPTDYQVRCMAARETAMRTGRAVRV